MRHNDNALARMGAYGKFSVQVSRIRAVYVAERTLSHLHTTRFTQNRVRHLLKIALLLPGEKKISILDVSNI